MARHPTTECRYQCLDVIEDLRTHHFEKIDFRCDLDINDVTTIWQTPERLKDENDATLLRHVLWRQLTIGNYGVPLTVFKAIGNSRDSHEFKRNFPYFLLELLREERKKKIDHHIILAWLDEGEQMVCQENQPVLPNRKTYTVLKALYFVKIWKMTHECYSCGCLQKQIVDLFLGDNCLLDALFCILKSQSTDIYPLFVSSGFFKSAADIQPLDIFCYYLEVLQEMRQCSAVEIEDAKTPSSLIQMTGLLLELKLEDVPKACSELHRVFTGFSEIKEKQRSLVETVLKNKLIPKIFECFNNSEMKLENFNRASIQKFVDLIEKESYPSTIRSNEFGPLQLLNYLHTKYDIWSKTKQLVESKIENLNLGTQQGTLIVVYLLSLIYRFDASLLGRLVDALVNQYAKTSRTYKNRVLLTLEIAEQLGKSKSEFSTYFKGNRIKTKLLLATELDSSDSVDVVFEYLPLLDPSEFNQFLELRFKTLSEECLSDLFYIIKNTDVHVTSNEVWNYAVEKKNRNQDAISFIENQLKKLVDKKDTVSLGVRLGPIFKQLRSVTASRELLLAIPQMLLSLQPAQYSTLPTNTSNSLFPALLISYCLFYEGNEQKITELFKLFLEKIRNTRETVSAGMGPIELMEQICQVIKNEKFPICDIRFIRPSTGGDDTFLKSLHNVFKNDLRPRAKERMAGILSVIFENLVLQLQTLGDQQGSAPFCEIAQIVDKYIASDLPSSQENSEVWKVAERMTRGYSFMTEKWNKLFTRSRALKIITSATNHVELLKRVMTIVQDNKVLLDELKKRSEFTPFEHFVQ